MSSGKPRSNGKRVGVGTVPAFPARLEGRAKQAAPAAAKVLRPQRPVHEAAVEQSRQSTPLGLGMDSQRVRLAMVQRLQQAGLRDARVVHAMAQVPRHLFVDTALAIQAYEDTSLPIGLGQTISKPSIVSRMIELLCTRPGVAAQTAKPLGRVMEVGSGCGYQAAVLAQLARQVVSIERLRGLHDKARQNLRTAGVHGVRLVLGDGMVGQPGSAPFDCIIAAAGGQELPAAWLEQLAPGGRLVAPVQPPGRTSQVLVVVDKNEDGSVVQRIHEAVHFVPLKSGVL